MRPVTQRFLDAVRGSHAMAARARVVPAGLIGTNPGDLDALGRPVNEIPIVAGDVKLDGTADIRGTLDLETMFDWPADATGLLTPYGNEIFVERGIAYGDGSIEWVSQGYYRIYAVDQDTAPNGPIKILAKDRMSGIIDAVPEAPQVFTAGTSVQSIFTTVVGDVFPGATINFDFAAGSTTFPENHVMDDDRYRFLKDIVDSLGKVMYWDYRGRLQVESAPSATMPVFEVTHGRGGVLVSLARSLDREGVFNAVVATGEAPGEAPPVRAVVYDSDPTSPTYYWGPYGKVPLRYTSSMITTTVQALAAAQAKLDRLLGLPYNIDLSMVPNSALEPLDPVSVSFSDKWAAETHVLESLTIPLTADGALTGTTRKQVSQ